ncbi:MAG: DUF1934 family protein [Bacilli bacterium]|nr:DUF1934 family protein [Bacilli bacterium]
MKIKLKATLKNKEETHTFKGKAILNENIITYKDGNTLTKIKIDDIITIERKDDYQIILNLKKGIKLKGNYITKYGNIGIETYTKDIIKKENSLKIIYDLTANNELIDTFTYYCEYSIDS